ncbi:hypothetical protein JX265_000680 [Neoarthrinium moseri]|uniref:Uncharacterized protein n=1 Tax=Neoarthrinium moseri TaxID=1658444 RepID=A0A9P9WZ13_9PEZI|nr:hypothetical protein JX265_000680 [Neoarthrinium moseri]
MSWIPDRPTWKLWGVQVWSLLASNPSAAMMGCLFGPAALWLTFSRRGRSADSCENMSPDSVSSLFPDRPIRPLPKRRLRERLSPDVADTIKYPPEPQNNAPLFYYPYNLKSESGTAGAELGNVVNKENGAELAQEPGPRRHGLGGEIDEEGHIHRNRRSLATRPLHESSAHAMRTPPRASQGRHQIPQPPPSTASSADGYDSFENTNNKKKRKIPTAGESILNSAHALNDASILGVPSPPMTGDEGSGDALAATPSPYAYSGGTATNGQGISGPGRGRYGRNRSGRSPLRQVPDPNSNWPVKNSKPRSGGQYPVPTGENAGIISNAIASAEKLPVPPGQENISLLHQQASTKVSPDSSQFTFTFDSQVPGTVSWPGSESSSSHLTANNQSQQGIMTGDSKDVYYGGSARPQPGQVPQTGSAGTQTLPSGQLDAVGKGASPANAPPKKAKRRGNPLLQAARQRRQEQEYKNYHHPPSPEDVWICEFCEYERIFGRPPEALIRQYEIKDRRRRREEAERRRLLEKAKMKSRKGKKPSKLPAKNNAPAQDRNPAMSANQVPPMDHDPNQDIHSEEFEEDDYYEDDVHDDNCPAVARGLDFESHASSVEGYADHGGPEGGGHDTRVPVS